MPGLAESCRRKKIARLMLLEAAPSGAAFFCRERPILAAFLPFADGSGRASYGPVLLVADLAETRASRCKERQVYIPSQTCRPILNKISLNSANGPSRKFAVLAKRLKGGARRSSSRFSPKTRHLILMTVTQGVEPGLPVGLMRSAARDSRASYTGEGEWLDS